MMTLMATSGGRCERSGVSPEVRSGVRSGVKKMKVAVIGDKQVGKTSLISRFLHDSFSPHYIYTIGGEIESVEMTINGSRVCVTFVDAAGHEYVRTLMRSLYSDAHGVMLVFDVTRTNTFLSVNDWLHQIEMANPNSPVVFLVGNKVDQVSHRSVHREEAMMQGVCMHLQYFETSAKSCHNVREIFTKLLQAAYRNITPSLNALSPLEDSIKLSSSDTKELHKEDNVCCATS